MKKILTIIPIFLIILGCDLEKNKTKVVQNLILWQYSKDSIKWLNAYIPESLIQQVKRDTLIDNYFYSENYKRYEFIYRINWYYTTKFTVPLDFNDRQIELSFNEIIGIADIFVNQKYIQTIKNSYISHNLNITPYIIKGENTITLKFHSISDYIANVRKRSKIKLKYNGWEQTRIPKFFVDTTNNLFFLPLGLTRNVELIMWKRAIIRNIYYQTLYIDTNQLKLKLTYEIDADNNYTFNLKSYMDNKIIIDENISISKGRNTLTFYKNIDKPRLWYPYSLGEPYLYEITTTLSQGKKEIDKKTEEIGFKKIRIDTAANKFEVYINDKLFKIIAVDYISFFNNQSPNLKFEKIIDDVKIIGANTIRIPENGLYADDIFYQLCNKEGIVVWQDLMLPYKNFDTLDNFTKQLQIETIQVAKRLRNNVCIAFWNLNNKFNETETNEHYKSIIETLTQIVKQIDSSRYFLNNIKSNYFYKLDNTIPSFPSIFVISQTIQSDKQYIGGKQVDRLFKPYTQKNNLDNIYTKKYNKSKYFQGQVFISYIESFKETDQKIKKYLNNQEQYSGLILGDLYDVTPIISTSITDFNGLWKSKFYCIKKWHSNYIFDANVINGIINISAARNIDTVESLHFIFKLVDTKGKVYWRRSENNIQITSKKFQNYFSFNISNEIRIIGDTNLVFKLEAYNNESLVGEYYHTFVPDEKLSLKNPNFRMKIFRVNGGHIVEISSDVFAKYVYLYSNIDGMFYDNFFDILPGETKKIFLKHNQAYDDLTKLIRIIDYTQIYRSDIFQL